VRLIFWRQYYGISDDPIHRRHTIGIGITDPTDLHGGGAIFHHTNPAGLGMAAQIHQNINAIGADLRDNCFVFQGANRSPGIENPAQPDSSSIGALADIIGRQMKPRTLMRGDRRFQKIPNGMLTKITRKHADAQAPFWVWHIGEGAGAGRAKRAA